MTNSLRVIALAVLLPGLSSLFIASSGVSSVRAAVREEWLPVTPAELSLAASSVEPGADAEAFFWDIRVQDREGGGDLQTVSQNYVRLKVFNDRGKETQSKVEIPYTNRARIANIAARTIKPDGTIVELEPNAVFDRTIVKFGNIKVNVKSFAMPAVEPGCILEYRWQETGPARIYQRLTVQRDLPVQRVTYHIKPFNAPGFELGMRFKPFNCEPSGLQKEGGGFYKTEILNVKAFREEPHMPPEDFVRAWILLMYTEDTGKPADVYWSEYGKDVFNRTKSVFKVSDEVRRIAAEVTAGATTDAEKIERIHTFCRTKIKNTSDDASGLTDDERAKLKDNKNASDTLKSMQGTGDDINVVFAAMCTAAGFEVRPAAVSDRGDFLFDKSFTNPYFLQAVDIAVKVGGAWTIYDPASAYVPAGMLGWREENTQVLVTDPKEPVWVRANLTSADVSKETRTGTFVLSEDGTLEGDVRIEYEGHPSIDWKEFYDDESPGEREKAIIADIQRRLSTAEVTKVSIENVTDVNKSFAVGYHLRIPGFAQRTGKRIFFQPAFFRSNVAPRFTATERKHPICFQYPFTEIDSVTITLPDGYELESADQPETLSLGRVGGYDVKILTSKDGRMVKHERSLKFGADGSIFFPAAGYATIKRAFDAIHKSDGHMLTLRQKAAS